MKRKYELSPLKEEQHLKKLYDGVQRFCARHPRFGIPNLMLFISIGAAIVYILTQFNILDLKSMLVFNRALILRGQIWRLFTFIFVPMESSHILLLAISEEL